MTTLLFFIVIIDIISFDVSHNGVSVYITSFGCIIILIVILLAINKQLKIIKKN